MNTIKTKILISFGVIFIFFTLVAYFTVTYEVRKEFIETEKQHAQELMGSIDLYIENEKQNLDEYREFIIEKRRQELKNLTQLVFSYFDMELAKAKADNVSEKNARENLLEGVKQFKYGNNDYFFVFDKNLIMISHPDARLKGIDANKVADKKGKFHIKEIFEKAKKDGEGTSLYHWNRLNKDGHFLKLGYGAIYKPLSLLVVSGTYIDDVETEVANKYQKVVTNLKDLFKEFSFKGGNNYLYLIDDKGEFLVHPNLEGQNAKELVNRFNGDNIFNNHRKLIETGESTLEYKWNHPEDKKRFDYDKVSFITFNKPFGWFIGSSHYYLDLKQAGAAINKKLILYFGVMGLIALGICFYVSERITNPLKDLTLRVKNLNLTNLSTTEVGVEGSKEVIELSSFLQKSLKMIEESLNHNVNLLTDLESYKNHLEEKVDERTEELAAKTKKLENTLKELQKTKDKLVAKEKLASLGVLSAGIAHELKNPLNIILNSSIIIKDEVSEIIQYSTAGADQVQVIEDMLDTLLHNCQRADKIIHSMLQHGNSSGVISRPFFFDDILQECIESSKKVAKNKFNKEFQIEIESDEVGHVKGDKLALGRMFTNIFENALYAVNERSVKDPSVEPKIEVKVQNLSHNNTFLVHIKDNGSGISQENLKNIMNPFFTTKPTGSGTGLGMSLVNDVVMAHHGEMTVNSEENKYTEIILIFPKNMTGDIEPSQDKSSIEGRVA